MENPAREPALPSTASRDSEKDARIRTFLLADIRGYSRFTEERGDEAAGRLAALFAQVTREVVEAYGGRVLELRGDEALAIFDSARQALRSAAALQQRYVAERVRDTSSPLRVGIGLDAGEAVPVEGGFRGQALNLAARLSSLAGPDEILVSRGVSHLAGALDDLAFQDRGSMEIKGFAAPVEVVGVTVAAADPGDESGGAPAQIGTDSDAVAPQQLPIGGFLGALPDRPIVARDPELERCKSALESAIAGSGRLLLLAGEPGAGKTRLAQEVSHLGHGRGCLIAAGHCYEPHQAAPYYPFLEAMQSLYAACSNRIREQARRRWPHLARLLPDEFAPPAASGAGSYEEQQRLHWSVTGFIQAVADQTPVVILLDDLHWADPASLDLLHHLARQTRSSRVLLVGTLRDTELGRQHPLERSLLILGREALADRIAVRRLSSEGTGRLATALIGEQIVSEELIAAVHRQTEGNAFFTAEVVRSLLERGDIVARKGQWSLREHEDMGIPESVRSVIGERVGRLDQQTQELLREASVLGQTFSFEDLQRLSGREEIEIDVALNEAISAGLIREMGKTEYHFNHGLTQHALYAELSSLQRRRLHLAAGEALSALPERIRHRRATELARHFLEGADAERALPYTLMVGDQAESAFSHENAEVYYRMALDLAREIADRSAEAVAWERLGGLLTATIRYREALTALEKASEAYRQTSETDSEGRVLAQIGRVYLSLGDTEAGLAHIDTALRGFGSPGRESRIAALQSVRAKLLFARGEYEAALAAADSAGPTAAEAGDGGVRAEAAATRGGGVGHAWPPRRRHAGPRRGDRSGETG